MIEEPGRLTHVYRGEDIPRILENHRSGGFKEVLLTRWCGDWGLGEGETRAFIRRDEVWGTELVIMIRHSINDPIRGSRSILEFAPLYIDKAAEKEFIAALLGQEEEQGEDR